MGLRAKISLAIAAITLLSIATLGFFVHARQANASVQSARFEADRSLREAVKVHLNDQDSGRLTELNALPEPLRGPVSRGLRATYLQGNEVMWAATKVGDDVIAVQASFADERDELEYLDRLLTGGGAAVSAVAALLGLLIATGLSRRLTATAKTANRIADGDLSARVNEGSPAGRAEARVFARGSDEAAQLASAVDAMADSLQARLEAERRVTADVAHELRTPVAGLVTAAELLPPGQATDMVRDRVVVLRHLIEDVLEVARLDAQVEPPDLDEWPISTLVQRAAHEAAVPVKLNILEDALVRTDRRRVERIVGNLVANAARHGAPPIIIEAGGHVIRVRDHGPGFPDELLRGGPQRFRTGAKERGQGTGLGLTIAMGQAAVLGAVLTFENDGGAVATLDLPE